MNEIKKLLAAVGKTVWAPLGVLSASLAVISFVVRQFGVELSKPNEDVLYAYHLIRDRIFFFSVEWWAPFKVPDAIKNYVILHIVAAITELRMRSRVDNFIDTHHEKFLPENWHPFAPGGQEAGQRAIRKAVLRSRLWAVLLGPFRIPLWFTYFFDAVREAIGMRKNKKHARTSLIRALSMLFWLTVVPLTVVAYFFVNAALVIEG